MMLCSLRNLLGVKHSLTSLHRGITVSAAACSSSTSRLASQVSFGESHASLQVRHPLLGALKGCSASRFTNFLHTSSNGKKYLSLIALRNAVHNSTQEPAHGIPVGLLKCNSSIVNANSSIPAHACKGTASSDAESCSLQTEKPFDNHGSGKGWNGNEGSHWTGGFGIAAVLSASALNVAQCEGDGTEELKVLPPPKRKVVSTWDLFAVLEGEWLFLIAALILTLFHTLLSLGIPAAFSAVMNCCRERLDLAQPIRGFVLLQGAIIVLDSARHFILSLLGERIRKKLRLSLYTSLLQQEVAYFDVFGAEFSSMLGEDIFRIQQGLTDQILNLVTSVATLAYGSYKVITISPKATLLVLLSFPILSMANLLAQGSCRKKALEVVAASRGNVKMATEVLANARTVQSLGVEGSEAERYRASLEGQYALECEYRAYSGAAHLLFSSINTLLSAFGLWYGGSLVAQGKTSLEDMMQFMQYSWKVGGAMSSLMSIYNEQHKTLAAASRVLTAIRRQPRILRGRGDQPAAVEGHVELRNVTFRYPTRPETAVIKGLSMTLKPGSVTALVGGSGNGKSTVAWLVQRFYDVEEGQVLIDGKDVRTLDIQALRSHIALVGQEPVLFHGTVADNVRLGRPDATMPEIVHACVEAGADEFITNMPNGYNSLVDQVSLSAGQRQRLSIARAIIRNPAILILDEATSQLDAKTEAQVQEALERVMKGRTVLVIAHRLSAVRGADRICVVEDGRIVEEGSHNDLLRRGGLYALLARKQMQA